MKDFKTSDSHPIYVNIIDHTWQGKLGITFAPGKYQTNAMEGRWNRDISKDLQRIRNYYKMDVLVCLLQKKQMSELNIPNELTQCTKHGLKTQHYQVVDNTVPKDQIKYKQLVKRVVDEYLCKGLNVVVHCKGGLGRAGTFAASCLIYSKHSAKNAINLVRNTRKNIINNLCQQQWLHKLKF